MGDDLEGDSLTTGQLAQLTYLTLFSLPADCNFSQFRVTMENAADTMAEQGLLSESQVVRVIEAFFAVGVPRVEDLYGVNKDATLRVFDVNNEPYADYTVTVTPWNSFWRTFETEDAYELDSNSVAPLPLDFPGRGTYSLRIVDQDNPYMKWSAQVSVGWFSDETEIELYTSLGNYKEDSGQSQVAGRLPGEASSIASGSRDVALVLDVSGSMSGDPIAQMKEAVQGFLDTAVGGGAQVGLVSYSGEAQVHERLDSSDTALSVAVSDLSSGGNTNIEDGLVKGEQVLSAGNADRRIIVLMSDGAPNEGKTGDGLIAYADELKERGYKIYTVGFNEGPEGYSLLSQIASEGCHYEVQNADDLEGFFTDIADEISGARFVYARVACPVDVEVSYGGETLSSSPGSQNLRTSFGTIALEDEVDSEGNIVEEDGIKVLRLREGPAYDLDITGVGTGEMDCSLGFADAKGDYTDFRNFENIAITPSTRVYTTTEETDRSRLTVDADGDGVIDYAYEASSNGRAQLVDNHLAIYLTFAGCAVVTAALGVAARELRGWGRLRAA